MPNLVDAQPVAEAGVRSQGLPHPGVARVAAVDLGEVEGREPEFESAVDPARTLLGRELPLVESPEAGDDGGEEGEIGHGSSANAA